MRGAPRSALGAAESCACSPRSGRSGQTYPLSFSHTEQETDSGSIRVGALMAADRSVLALVYTSWLPRPQVSWA